MGKRTNNTDHVGFTGSITKIWVAINSLITSVANIPIYTLPSTIEVAQINEKVNGDGVNIEGIGFNNNIMYSDTIKEYNSDHGVTIDGLLIKDSTIPGFILPLVPAMGTITATGTTAATA